jgi:TPP-dependent pyruvate/acetoin dehydrogenase alpha subunit
MLSENLEALRSRFSEYTGTGVEMNGAAVEAMCLVLAEATEDARQLERSAVPVPSQRRGAPFDVITGGRS